MKRVALAIALLLLASAPYWVGNSYYVNVATQILIFAVLALGLNVLVGYAGLVTLGHASLFGIAAYAGASLINAGYSHIIVASGALLVTLATTAIFAVLALRGTGLGFVMITVALGQIVWGIAYRWISLTNGDNGVSINARPEPFGLSLISADAFYWATLVVFLVTVGAMLIFVASPFGAAVRGTRDQPRRMTALGYNVWLTRFVAFLFSGLWSGVAGLLYLYYNQFVSPQTVALSASAEALLMVIAGGTATLMGPIAGAALVIIMKDIASAYIERWNFVLGAIFVLIVIFMPEGLVPGAMRLCRWGVSAVWPRSAPSVAPRGRTMTALELRDLNKAFGGLRVTSEVNLAVAPGERRLIIGPNGAGKTTLFNLITGELRVDAGRIMLFDQDITGVATRRRAHLGLSRTYQIITLFPRETLAHNVTLSLLGLSPLRWNPIVRLNHQRDLHDRARAALAQVGLDHLADRPVAQTSYGERRRVEIAMALAQRPKVLLLDEPFAGLSVEERRDVLTLIGNIPRDVTIVMIEHDMDVALEFAERITVLHFGRVIVEGTRTEVVQHPRSREIYLGE